MNVEVQCSKCIHSRPNRRNGDFKDLSREDAEKEEKKAATEEEKDEEIKRLQETIEKERNNK